MRNLLNVIGVLLIVMPAIALIVMTLNVMLSPSRGAAENCAVLAPLQGYISVHNERSGELV